MTIAESVAHILLKNKAVMLRPEDPFTWTSGIRSPIYCDNRILTSDPEGRKLIVHGFTELIKTMPEKPDVIAGTATAGISWAAWIADSLNLPMVYVRSKPKAHGAGKQVEGRMAEGSKVLVIEDLLSTGGSSIDAAHAVEREGGKVVGIAAIFSYELAKGKKNFEESGFWHGALSNIKTLLSVSDLGEAQKAMVAEFASDPATWGEKHGFPAAVSA